jgi:hypothetical protein
MKGSVIQNYIDAQTGKAYSIGDKVEYAEDRARFLAEKGYVKLADVPKAEPVAKVEKAVVKASKVETKAVKPAAKPTKTTKKK